MSHMRGATLHGLECRPATSNRLWDHGPTIIAAGTATASYWRRDLVSIAGTEIRALRRLDFVQSLATLTEAQRGELLRMSPA